VTSGVEKNGAQKIIAVRANQHDVMTIIWRLAIMSTVADVELE